MTPTDTVLYDKTDHIVTITMNRPASLNAFNTEMYRGLAEAFIDFRDDPDARVAILTGAGDRAFSAGMDLKERVASGEEGLGFPDIAPLENPFWPQRKNLVPKPIIAAVNGYAVGGGFYMAQQADLCIASTTAQFEVSEILRGTVAGWESGFLQNLPVPAQTELAFGTRIGARRAYDVGLVVEVVEPDELAAAARARAEAILRMTPLLQKRNLELVRSLRPEIPADIWGREALYIEECRYDPDGAEALAAFAERRTPVWKYDQG